MPTLIITITKEVVDRTQANLITTKVTTAAQQLAPCKVTSKYVDPIIEEEIEP
jgi:hypothetical protein